MPMPSPAVGAGGEAEVVLEPALVSVVVEVDSGPDARVADALEGRDVGSPLRGVIAAQVVDDAGEAVRCAGGEWVRPCERKADRLVGLAFGQSERRAAVAQRYGR